MVAMLQLLIFFSMVPGETEFGRRNRKRERERERERNMSMCTNNNYVLTNIKNFKICWLWNGVWIMAN